MFISVPYKKRKKLHNKDKLIEYDAYNTKNNKKIFFGIFLTIVNLLTIIYFEKNKKLLKDMHNVNDINADKYLDTEEKIISNFDYISYENNTITNDMKEKAGWMHMSQNQYFLINGIIRKHKPKNCLEVGVAEGGSSILILNAIKDIEDSQLISLDLNSNFYLNPNFKTGYRVQKYFPELTKKWQLFTGEQPHIFLEKLNKTFDFVFLDTAHVNPGELINFIEIIPFLKENAIIILHDIIWHFLKEIKSLNINPKIRSISSPTLLLLSTIHGDKIIIKNEEGIDNMGAVYLYKNQKEYYLSYFLLLLNFWEYMPSDKQLEELRIFIKKYYDNDLYLSIFELAVKNNINYVKKLQNSKK